MDSPAVNWQSVALILQYQGTHFYGWQRQPNDQRTVQQEIEKVLQRLLGQPTKLYGAGRTDTGVHAAAQVAHFQTTSPVPPHRWAAILNSRLPQDILVRASAGVDAQWHARFSAISRRYRYTLYTGSVPNLFIRPFTWHYYHAPLDDSLMQKALGELVGRYHLAAFHRANSSRKHSWVEIKEAVCYREGPFVHIEVEADGFLYGMMRLLVGMLVQLGQGKRSLEDFRDLWTNERREEVKYAAPACGLCLLRVYYPDSPFPETIWADSMPKFYLGQW